MERLEAQLALRAQVANLVNLVAGAHVGFEKNVKIDIEDVQATAMVRVRLQNVYKIIARTLATIDAHPEILPAELVSQLHDQVASQNPRQLKRQA